MPFGTMLGAAEGLIRTMHLPDEPLGVELTFWGGLETGNWSFNNNPEEYVKKIHCPVLLQWGEKDNRVTQKETDHIYKFYFYDKTTNKILFTWTRPSGRSTTTFAFVSINDGLDLGHWKDVNDDYGFFENRKILKDFEETILERIKNIIRSSIEVKNKILLDDKILQTVKDCAYILVTAFKNGKKFFEAGIKGKCTE